MNPSGAAYAARGVPRRCDLRENRPLSCSERLACGSGERCRSRAAAVAPAGRCRGPASSTGERGRPAAARAGAPGAAGGGAAGGGPGGFLWSPAGAGAEPRQVPDEGGGGGGGGGAPDGDG